MKRLLIIGAGGFGRAVLAWARDIEANQDDWEIEQLGISSATRADAVWQNGALHLVVVDPDTDVVRYARATWE